VRKAALCSPETTTEMHGFRRSPSTTGLPERTQGPYVLLLSRRQWMTNASIGTAVVDVAAGFFVPRTLITMV
jgi:hypothetical protein